MEKFYPQFSSTGQHFSFVIFLIDLCRQVKIWCAQGHRETRTAEVDYDPGFFSPALFWPKMLQTKKKKNPIYGHMQSSQALLHTTAFPLVEISFQCIHILCESILTTLFPLYIDCFLKVTYSLWENSLCEYLQYFVNTVYYSRAGRAFHFGLLCAELLLFFCVNKASPWQAEWLS